MHPDLAKAASFLGVSLPALDQAAKGSRAEIEQFKTQIKEVLEELSEGKEYTDLHKTDVVLLGSIARYEATPGSDCDYFVLQNGASPETSQDLVVAVETVRKRLEYHEPGGQGVFGNIVIAPNLYESIGLESDTNKNITQRLLLLTESKSVLSEETHLAVVDNILLRYCADYLPPKREAGSPAKVPRYLLNDFVRFWRTVAVDFGTKRWRTIKDDSHLRHAKLRITRKILFAGPLATLLLVPNRVQNNNSLKDYLRELLKKPPLAQLASTAEQLSDISKEALRKLLKNYDDFINLLGRRGTRKVFQDPKSYEKGFEQLKIKTKEIGDTIQESLEAIFNDDPLFKSNFRKYATF